MPSHKEIAQNFLKLVVSGKIDEAYEKYVSPQFFHHNAYYKGDRQTLMNGMKENHGKFPNKSLEIQRAIEDGDIVAVHSRLLMESGKAPIAVVHIFRFEGDLIMEEWDVGMQLPEEIPNENGAF